MLTHIHIKNFVIVKSLSLDFQNGLHVLTGETGAGKSIWIDAIEIGLGGRTDTHIIYPGEKTCDITLCFDLKNQPDAKQWLLENDLPAEDECIIRRLIDHEKPSRTTINGLPVPQKLTRQLAQHILCIHGQHQHQQLLKSDAQQTLLDDYAHNNDLLKEIHKSHAQWQSIEREMQALTHQSKNKVSDLTLWHYQLDELEQLHISDNEYDELFTRYQRLHYAKHYATTLNESLALIHAEDTPSAIEWVEQSLRHIESIHLEHKKIDDIKSLLKTAAIHLHEARDALAQYCYDIDFSADTLDKIEQRLSTLQDVARKHRCDPTQLFNIIQALRDKITQLEEIDTTLESLTQQKNSILTDYQKLAIQLSARRKKSAKQFGDIITEQMQALGMEGGVFQIALQKNNSPINPHGNEQVNFLIATNPGQTPHDLSHIVSGGELSRLSLIIQVLTAQKNNTPTLIFDEVDVGIGGKTADLVGRLLRKLSLHTQVLCVTHLPQVAACGHHHFHAQKITENNSTTTVIHCLNKQERANELARMLSGAQVTEKSILHANELLDLLR